MRRVPKDQRSAYPSVSSAHEMPRPALMETNGAASSAPPSSPTTGQHARHSDRADADGDDADAAEAARLPVFCRYKDLVAAGIATSWMQVRRLIEHENFPPGLMLSRNVRAWPVREIEGWLSGRPCTRKTVNIKKTMATKRRKKLDAEASNGSLA
jgi:hypothetical protein